MKDFLLALVGSFAKQLGAAVAMIAAFFSGVAHEKKSNTDKENDLLRDLAGKPDGDVADFLRERAKAKDGDKRKR